MKPDFKRKWLSRCLLAIYLLILSTTMLHVHEHEADHHVVCQDCADHVSHDSHLSDQSHTHDACLFCDYLSTSYTTATAQALDTSVAMPMLLRGAIDEATAIVGRAYYRPGLRAPPCL